MSAQLIHLKASEALTTQQERITKDAIFSGEILIFPTDTLYGLGCDAFNAQSVRKIAEIKERSLGHPFSVHLGRIEEIESYAILTQYQQELIKRLLPGPFTLLLEALTNAPAPCVGMDGKIGIRVPKSNSFSKLYSVTGRPLMGTSVNVSDQPALTSIHQIISLFSNKVNVIIVTDEIMSQESSSVIDLTTTPPKALRGELPKSLLL
ncbi:threonylcarbamoyl-AMP synthase [Candidatus Acetothermia bacterium]|nr:threonylcarbamoyl-AMP synthase [Candidatus Acetothermia bacterium]MBI3643242.1 threonylcarbamoyl-AMP synthase [Candidatus Acetothermia bacterium]